MMEGRLYWPVLIEDRSHWSDERTIEVECYNYRTTLALTTRLNSKYHDQQQRVVPGSIEQCSFGIRARVSNALWKVNKAEYLAAAELKDSSGIWHVRYQLCNSQTIGGNDGEIEIYLLQGTSKPWNVPIGYVRDGGNIVLIRSKVVEDYLKRQLIKRFYKDGRLMVDIDGEIKSITEHVGNHPTKTTQHEQPT